MTKIGIVSVTAPEAKGSLKGLWWFLYSSACHDGDDDDLMHVFFALCLCSLQFLIDLNQYKQVLRDVTKRKSLN